MPIEEGRRQGVVNPLVGVPKGCLVQMREEPFVGLEEGGASDVSESATVRIPLLKAAFDKSVALVAMLAFAPLFVLVGLAIKIDGWLHREDRGKVLYREARVSHGEVFDLLKFRVLRTQVMEEARGLKGYDHAKPLEAQPGNMTRVGRFLQRWYVDELPQLLNVLRGDLSLVGPRPWPVVMYEDEVARNIYRKQVVRAGLTGLVQAHKDELDAMGGDRALDEAYVHACRRLGAGRLLLLDLRVIGKTFKILLQGQGL
jgi:lipopolysaccharide/colanic/teichoic acid biosynthesis glycosyltransferase